MYKGRIEMFRRFGCCNNYSRRCGCVRQSCINMPCRCTREVLNINEITYDELLQKVKEGATLIDVRTRQEFLEEHLERAILIPYYEIARRIGNIVPDKDRTIILYCKNGGRSIRAYTILSKLGYSNLYNLKDGLEGI